MIPKILELDGYCNFRNGLHLWIRTGRVKTKNNNEKILEEERELEKECSPRGNYDGPLSYLEEAPEVLWLYPTLPEKEGIKYCFRIEKVLVGESFYVGPEPDYYECYCYQIGRWWKYKKPQYLFYDLHVPLFDRETYYKIVKSKTYKYLDKKYQKTFNWWRDKIEIINTGRRSSFWVRKTLKKIKKKSKK